MKEYNKDYSRNKWNVDALTSEPPGKPLNEIKTRKIIENKQTAGPLKM